MGEPGAYSQVSIRFSDTSMLKGATWTQHHLTSDDDAAVLTITE